MSRNGVHKPSHFFASHKKVKKNFETRKMHVILDLEFPALNCSGKGANFQKIYNDKRAL